MTNKHVYAFGAFQLDPQQKILLRDGERIPLHPKTYATLQALLESNGEVISKDDLLAKVWPDTFVEESNLTKNISILRKALSNGHDHSGYIETIPTIGYRFVEPVNLVNDDTAKKQRSDVAKEEREEEISTDTENPLVSRSTINTSQRRFWLWAGLALFLCLITSVAWFKWPRSQPASASIGASVAVMPFLNLTGDVEHDYFSDGLTEHLIQDLSRLKDFKVISRDSVFRFKGKAVDWREAGKQLNVAAILEGSLNLVNDRLQINVRLRSTQDGRILWASEHNNEALDKVLTIEKEIGCSVASNMQVILCNDESSKLQTNNIDAYLAYLKGLYQFNLRTSESLKQAIKYFEQAVALDPNFAEGWASVADVYFLGKWYVPLPNELVTQKGGTAAKKAWALDQKSAHACLMMSKFARDVGQQSEADKFVAQILSLNPNYASFLHSHGLYVALIGRYDEGISLMNKAQQLDPLSLVIDTDVGYLYYIARRYDEAIGAYRKVIKIDAEFSLPHLLLGLALTQKGQHDEAIAEVQRASDRGSEYLGALGNVYARAGKQTEALSVLKGLQQMARTKYIPPYQIAWIYCGLGDTEQALPLMQQSIAKNVGVIDFKHHPIYEPLLADTRYQALLSKAHFPW